MHSSQRSALMRRAASIVVLTAAASALTLPAFSAPPADGGTQIKSATLTVDKSTLTGTELGTMTVAVQLSDSQGISPTQIQLTDVNGMTCPCAQLGITDAADMVSGRPVYVPLQLTSGTTMDGTWTGTTTVGASDSGHWVLKAVGAGTLKAGPDVWGDFSMYPVDGDSLGAATDVTGSNPLVLTVAPLHKAVAVGTAYPASGHVSFSATGDPAAGVNLVVEPDCMSMNYSRQFARQVTTDSDGNWHTSWAAPIYDPFAACDAVAVSFGLVPFEQYGANAVSTAVRVFPNGFSSAYWTLSIRASSARAPAVLTGALAIASPSLTVTLQRLVSGSWHPVAHQSVGKDGRSYRFPVRSPGTYRVRAAPTLNGGRIAAGYSRTINLR